MLNVLWSQGRPPVFTLKKQLSLYNDITKRKIKITIENALSFRESFSTEQFLHMYIINIYYSIRVVYLCRGKCTWIYHDRLIWSLDFGTSCSSCAITRVNKFWPSNLSFVIFVYLTLHFLKYQFNLLINIRPNSLSPWCQTNWKNLTLQDIGLS